MEILTKNIGQIIPKQLKRAKPIEQYLIRAVNKN